MADNESTRLSSDEAASNDARKNKTLRISLDSARIPDLKKATSQIPGIPAHAAPIPQTIRLKRPPTSPIAVRPAGQAGPSKKFGETAIVHIPPDVRAATAPTLKRQTTRIGLDGAPMTQSSAEAKRSTSLISGIPMHAAPIPQTIRLKRPPTSPVIRPPTSKVAHPTTATVVRTATTPVIPKPSEPAAAKDGQGISEAPTIVKRLTTPKKMTSRIVLEDYTTPSAPEPGETASPPQAAGETPAPKTIRLKHPASLSAVDEAEPAKATAEADSAAKKGETSKIELPLEGGVQAPMSQRKTIRIKRTDRAGGARPSTPETAATPEPGVFAAPVESDEEHGAVFAVAAFAATLCIAALVYIMAAQALNIHLPLPPSMQLH